MNVFVKRVNLPEESIFGPLGELIKVSEKYKICVEVVGGNSLFHVVVDTEETASLIMQELYNIKGGRVTFMPLNRLYLDKNIKYPSMEEHHCTPLIKKIKYDPKFEKAVSQVFRKTLVVRDLVQGARLAKQFKLNTITLDGDKADNFGLLTGGFRDHFKVKRLDSIRELKLIKKKQETNQSELYDVRTNIKYVDQEIDRLNDEIKQQINKMDSFKSNTESLNFMLEKTKGKRNSLDERISQLVLNMERSIATRRVIQEKLEMFNSDLNKSFENLLTPAEISELESISSELIELQNNLNVTTSALGDVGNKINSIKAELDLKLLPQFRQVELSSTNTDSSAMDNLQNEISIVQSAIESLKIQHKHAQKELKNILETVETLTKERADSEKMLDKANFQQRTLLKKLTNYQKNAEKSMIRKQTLSARRDELQQKIKDIEFLSQNPFIKHNNLEKSELIRELTSVNDQISKMTNINKRASENFRKFDERKKEVIIRAQELDESKKSIETLIDKLKEQKVDAVETTFRKVSENFTILFEKMVPSGTGKLIIHKHEEGIQLSQGKSKKRRRNQEYDSTSQNLQAVNGSMYNGVSIEVSFNSKKDEQLRVEQLSGGQKTVCAIALILAIQMVDPAPFYLFDEIDAALDKQYRTAVATTIKDLSSEAQFICTTFRNDMITVADRFYRVKFENKISTVIEVNRNDALDFVSGKEKGLESNQ